MTNKLLLLLVFVSIFSYSQDTLKLLNGKHKLAVFEKIESDFVYYKKIKKDGAIGKRKKKNLDYIFSVNKLDTCIYVYQKDSLMGNYWSIEEMKDYIEGRRQARKYFKPYKTLLIGAGVGTGIAFYSLFPIKYNEKERYTINDNNDSILYKDYNTLTIPIPFWEVIPLSIYSYYSSKVKDVNRFKADYMEMFSKEMFVLGYKETVINRKTYSAFGSSLGSFLTTALGYVIFNPVEN